MAKGNILYSYFWGRCQKIAAVEQDFQAGDLAGEKQKFNE